MLVSNKKSFLFLPKLAEPTTCIVGIEMPVRTPNLEDYYNKQDIDKLLLEKLDAEELPNAINNALEQAKDSGEFDGYTPQKGKDYFTEEDKQEFIDDATPVIEGKIEEILGEVDLDGNASSIVYDSSMAETHDVANVEDALDKIFNKVYYVALSLSSSSGGGTYEKGSTKSITITAEFNKVPDRITINGDEITPSKTISKTYNNVTSKQTYTLIAYSTNAEGESINITKTFSALFVNKKYYGVSSKEKLISSEINALKSELDTDRKGDFTVNAGDGEYIFFAIPSLYGTPAFKVGGFDGGFDKVDTISHTNESGYTEDYDVYRSTNASLGSTTVTVN
jgi:hypothetical protein